MKYAGFCYDFSIDRGNEMNIPKNTFLGDITDSPVKPRLLQPKFHFNHDFDGGLKDHRGKVPVVMFTLGEKAFNGTPEGTHDSIRDGGSSGRIDFSGLRFAFCSMDDWVSAGNLPFWEN